MTIGSDVVAMIEAPESECCSAHKSPGSLVQTRGPSASASPTGDLQCPTHADLDFDLGEMADTIRETTERFAREKIAPIAAEIDETDEFPDPVAADGRAGLHGITVEEEWGGLGLGYLEHVVAQEEVARASASVGLSYGAHSNLCVNQIRRWGNASRRANISPADQRRACRRACDERGRRGQRRGRNEAQGRAAGNGYRLNGTKFWITNGRMRTRSSSTPRPARAAAGSPLS